MELDEWDGENAKRTKREWDGFVWWDKSNLFWIGQYFGVLGDGIGLAPAEGNSNGPAAGKPIFKSLLPRQLNGKIGVAQGPRMGK